MEITVKGRALSGFPKYIGQQNDNGAEEYLFRLPREYGGADLSAGFCYLLYVLPDKATGYILLEKEVTETELLARWRVESLLTALPGLLWLELRVSGLDGLLWHSEVVTATVAKGLETDTPAYVSPLRYRSRMAAPAANGAIPALMSMGGPAGDPFPNDEPPITIAERKIIIPAKLQNIAVQNDENSETVKILLPRWFDGNDLSTKTILLKTISSGGRDDIPLSPANVTDDTVEMHWILKPPQTSYAGKLRLQLYVQGLLDGDTPYKWETDASEVNIITSLDAEPVIPTEPSILTEFLTQVTELVNQAKGSQEAAAGSAEAAGASAQAAKESERAVLAAKEGIDEKAEAAKVSAQQAAESAGAAQASASSALTALEAARGLEEAAGESASAAAESAALAAQSKEAAGLSAVAAEAAAKTAQSCGESAETAAASAQRSATAAQASREAAKASETAAGENVSLTAKDALTASTAAQTATSEADRAKAEADRAQGIVGGDFATKAELEKKADKAAPSAAGNLAALDAGGNLTDSGVSPSGFELSGAVDVHAQDASLHKTKEDIAAIGSIPGKVDKADGMSLYPDADAQKLAGIEPGANNYTLPVANTELGGVKNGGSVTVNPDGTMDAQGGGSGLGLMAFEVDGGGCLIVKMPDNAAIPPLSLRDGNLILTL